MFGNQPLHPTTFGRNLPRKKGFFWTPSLNLKNLVSNFIPMEMEARRQRTCRGGAIRLRSTQNWKNESFCIEGFGVAALVTPLLNRNSAFRDPHFPIKELTKTKRLPKFGAILLGEIGVKFHCSVFQCISMGLFSPTHAFSGGFWQISLKRSLYVKKSRWVLPKF